MSSPPMSFPKISIATISFNQARFLEEAIQSILQQGYPSIEYIVVDPGSTDGSREIIERYRHQLASVILDPDDGPADGLNRAIHKATGDIFAYLNSDDAFVPGTFRQVAEAFAAHPEADVIYGNGFFIDEQGQRGRRFISDRYSPERSVRGCAIVMQQATFLRLGAVKEVGGFVVGNRTCWDAELLLDIALTGGRLVRIWRDWGLFRIHGASITGQRSNLEQYRQDCARQYEKVHGRQPGRRHRFAEKLGRLQKLVTDPKRTGAVVADRLGDRRKTGSEPN